jgi:hypothetical protein
MTAFSEKDGWVAAYTKKPCTGCGDCCKQRPCGLLVDRAPCPALYFTFGRYWCRLVEAKGPRELLIGYGCGATFIPKVFKNWKTTQRENKR